MMYMDLRPDIIRIMKERKKNEWLVNVEWLWHETYIHAVTWDMCTCSYILNHNEQSTLLSVAVMYVYTKLQTQWHVH